MGPAARDGPVREPRLPVDDRRALPALVPLFGTEDPNLMLTLGGVGLGLAIATATELVTLYPAGHATDHRGRRAVLIPALAGLAAITAVFGLASTPLMFMIAMGLLGVASGYAGVPRADALGRHAAGAEEDGGRRVPVLWRPGVRGSVRSWPDGPRTRSGSPARSSSTRSPPWSRSVSWSRSARRCRRVVRCAAVGPACSHAVRV